MLLVQVQRTQGTLNQEDDDELSSPPHITETLVFPPILRGICGIENSRVISGCSGMPWVWSVPRYPLALAGGVVRGVQGGRRARFS